MLARQAKTSAPVRKQRLIYGGDRFGGALWGLSAALFEATQNDPKTARYVK